MELIHKKLGEGFHLEEEKTVQKYLKEKIFDSKAKRENMINFFLLKILHHKTGTSAA